MGEFIDWVRNNVWAGWGMLAILLALAELATLDLTLLMLASGALLAGLTALVFPNLVWLQVIVALATAVATLFLLRPTLLRKVRNAPGYRSSLDALVGSTGQATAAITDTTGEVKVAGQVWQARSFDPGLHIEPGEQVEVFGLEGVTLVVYPLNRPINPR